MDFKSTVQLCEDALVLIFRHPKAINNLDWNDISISYIRDYSSDNEAIKHKAAVEAAIRNLSSNNYPRNFSYETLNQRIAHAEAVKKNYVHLNWLVRAISAITYNRTLSEIEATLLRAEQKP